MFGKQAFLVAASLTIVFFAGCIEAESAPAAAGGAPGQPQVAAGPAEFDDATGAVTGTVTTSDLAPIPNAQVGILQSDVVPSPLVVLTDESGQFTISRVPPGSHTMQTSALGFDAASKRVDVTAGAATTVGFVLTELPSDDPYMVTIYEAVQLSSIMYKLTPSCIYGTDYIPVTGQGTVDSYRTQAKTCGGLRFNELGAGGQQIFAGCDACESHTATEKYQSFNENWQTIVGEVTWQAQSGATGRGFLFDINAPNITRGSGGSINQASPYTWYKGTDQAPIVIRLDKPTSLVERNIPEVDWNNQPECDPDDDNNCDWFFRIFGARCDLGICDEGTGPDYGILIESKAEVYFSFFIRSTAPEGFSALPDG